MIYRDPRLSVVLVIGTYVIYFVNMPRRWVATQLEPLEREVAARLEVQAGEHYNMAVATRALGRAEHMEGYIAPQIMARAYSDCWKLSIEMFVASLTEVVAVLSKLASKLI